MLKKRMAVDFIRLPATRVFDETQLKAFSPGSLGESWMSSENFSPTSE